MTDPNAVAQNTPPDGDVIGTPVEDAALSSPGLPASGDECSRELEAARDKHLRLAAEFENFRRRTIKERQEAGWRAQGDLVRDLLDVFDDLDRFATVDPLTVDTKTLVEGVLLVDRKVMKTLASYGFEVINPVGRPFDPSIHEAMSTAPASGPEEDGEVALCFQVGYVINGQVLRPARVVVKQWAGA